MITKSVSLRFNIKPCLLFLALSQLLASAAASFSFNMPISAKPSKQRPSEYYAEFFETLPSMNGKTVVVTGASRGLGYVTALSLAKKGARIVLLNRKYVVTINRFVGCKSSPSQRTFLMNSCLRVLLSSPLFRSTFSDQSLAEIKDASTGPCPQFVECDLLDFASVRKAAETIKEQYSSEGVDVLCCNAGIMMMPDEASKDGYDITISTNVLSHFLLTKELLPELEKAASLRGEARIVNMSSGSGFGPPALNTRFFEQKGGNLGGQEASYERYHQSKLANLIFTSALHDRLQAKHSKVKVFACTPGVCATDMFLHATKVMKGKSMPLDAVPSTEDGSLSQLKCICDATVQSGDLWSPNMGGGLPVKFEISPPTVLSDKQAKDVLWDACSRAVGNFDP